jgi:hypothetical protein
VSRSFSKICAVSIFDELVKACTRSLKAAVVADANLTHLPELRIGNSTARDEIQHDLGVTTPLN